MSIDLLRPGARTSNVLAHGLRPVVRAPLVRRLRPFLELQPDGFGVPSEDQALEAPSRATGKDELPPPRTVTLPARLHRLPASPDRRSLPDSECTVTTFTLQHLRSASL